MSMGYGGGPQIQYDQPAPRRTNTGAIIGAVVGVVALVLLLVVGSVGYVVWRAAKAGEPKPFTSEEGRFTADMPGTPTITREPRKDGGEYVMHRSKQVFAGTSYEVMYFDEQPLEPGDYLLKTRKGYLNTVCERLISDVGTPVRDTALEVQGYPARELILPGDKDRRGKTLYVCIRYVVAGPRTYRLTADPVPAGGSAACTRFMDSLKIDPLAPVAWATYAPRGGEFSAEMPGKPRTMVTQSDDTPSVPIHVYSAVDPESGCALVVSHHQLKRMPAGQVLLVNETLDDACATFAEDHGERLATKQLKVSGYAARDMWCRLTKESDSRIWYRFVLTPRRLYRLYAAPIGDDDTPARRFMASFKVTG